MTFKQSWLPNIFRDEKLANTYFVKFFYQEGLACFRCNDSENYKVYSDKNYYCKNCQIVFTIRANTVFYNSRLPMHKLLFIASMCYKRTGKTLRAISEFTGIRQATVNSIRSKIETEGIHTQYFIQMFEDVDLWGITRKSLGLE